MDVPRIVTEMHDGHEEANETNVHPDEASEESSDTSELDDAQQQDETHPPQPSAVMRL